MAITYLEVNPPQHIPSEPRRGELRGALLSSVPVLTPADLFDTQEGQLPPGGWVGGITYVPEDCGAGGIYPNDCIPVGLATSNDHKTFPFDRAPVEWLPYLLYGSYTAATFCPPDEGRAKALRQLAACQSKTLETELWTGQISGPTGAINSNPQSVGFSPNIPLADPGAIFPTSPTITDWTTAVAIDPVSALAEVINAISQCGCSTQKYIHISPGLETYWWYANAIERDNNGVLRTKTGGHIIIPGDGYPGTAPDNGVVSGISWIYATSSMNVILGDVDEAGQDAPIAGNRSGLAVRENQRYYVAERYALTHWDRCCHIGIPALTCAPGECPPVPPVVTGGTPLTVLNNDWLDEGSAAPFQNAGGNTTYGIRTTNPPVSGATL